MKRDKQKYYQYLQSKQWKQKKEYALEYYGRNCGACGSKYNIQVHHKTYKNVFNETMEDLMLLCERCHRKEHKGKFKKKVKDSETITFYPKRSFIK